MSIATIAGVVAIAGTAYGAYSSNKASKAAAAQSGQSLDEAVAYARKHPEAFGSKPQSWDSLDFQPIYQQDPGYAGTAADAIRGNINNLGLSSKLSTAVNDYATEDSKRRIDAWDPSFFDSFAQQQQNTSNLLNGRLPFEDLQGIAARRSETNSILGGAGNQQQTAADLGLTRLSLMQQGQGALNSNADLISRVDPFARRITPQSMFVDPQQAVQNTIGENWNDYQAAVSERDSQFAYDSMADPYQKGLLELLAGNNGFQSGNQSLGGGMNWASTAAQLGNQLNSTYKAYNSDQQPQGGGGTSAWGTTTPATQYNTTYNDNGSVHNLSDQYTF